MFRGVRGSQQGGVIERRNGLRERELCYVLRVARSVLKLVVSCRGGGRLSMKTLVVCLVCLLSSVSLAQIAPLSSIWEAGTFLDVCGRPDGALSKEQLDAAKNAPPSQFTDKLKEEMSNRTVEVVMCLTFVSGLEQGWKEGHEHGVMAAQFPGEWPKDEKKALESVPPKQLQAIHAAMSTDVPCVPDYVTTGQKRDIVVKYIRGQVKANGFMALVPTYRMVYFAFQDEFPCPAHSTSHPPNDVK